MAFQTGLAQLGFVAGRNCAIEYRWAEGRDHILPELAADLVRRRVAVITTANSTQATLAAKAATSTIPIVFATGDDPIALGLVATFSHPGGNATGISNLNVELSAKRLSLLRELAPRISRFAVLANANSPMGTLVVKQVRASAPLGLPVEILQAATDHEIDAGFQKIAGEAAETGLMIGIDPFFFTRRARMVELALRYRVPTVYYSREYADIGGLLSYGTPSEKTFELVGVYTGRILKGEKPADLPVMQPTKFELVINVKTAQTLGLQIPDGLLALADEVVE
jgi:putative ABC transport system substrate-binding protein